MGERPLLWSGVFPPPVSQSPSHQVTKSPSLPVFSGPIRIGDAIEILG